MAAYDWSDERVATLEGLAAEGLTLARIADALGGGVTRNAVGAKLRRMKVEKAVVKLAPALPWEVVAFRDWFGVTTGAARVLGVLHAETGGLGAAVLAERAGATRVTLEKHLLQLRQAMDPGSIACRASAYILTDIGRADCAQALADYQARAA